MRSSRFYALNLAIFLAVSATLYRSIFTTWFLADEVYHVARLIDLSPWAILTDAGDPPGNFVPMLDLSLKLDWTLFGLSPIGYHVHACFVTALAALLVSALFRRWCTDAQAFVAGLVYLLLQPTVAVTSWICTVHYVTGTVFCLLAAVCALGYLDRPSRWWRPLPAALFYLLACLSKEIFILAPSAVVFLPNVGLRRRLWMLAHFALAGAAFLVWRAEATGGLLNRYGAGELSPRFVLSYFVTAWPQFTGWMLRDPARRLLPGLVIVNLVLLVALYKTFAQSWRHLAVYLTLFGAATAPTALVMGTSSVNFLATSSHYCLRFLYLPCVVIMLGGVWALTKFPPRVRWPALVGLVLAVAVNAERQVRPWIRDGGVTHKSALVYREWFTSRALIVTDMPLSLHLGLSQIWEKTEGTKTVARIYWTPVHTIPPTEPYLNTDGVTFVEDRFDGTTLLDKAAFVKKYVGPK